MQYNYPIFSVFNLLRQAYGLNKERVKFYGLNNLETFTLINIGHMEKPTQKGICEKLRAPKQTIHNVIKNLEDKGYIELDPSDNDNRAKILRLTPEGIKNRDEYLKPLLKANEKMYEKLGDEKIAQIKEALEILICAIKENYNKEN